MTVHFHVRFTRENAKKHDLCECEFASPSDVVFAVIRIETTMATFVIAYILIGIAQIWAAIEGMQLYFGIGGFSSLSSCSSRMPFLLSVRSGWHS